MQASGSYVLYLPDRHEESLMGWPDPVYDENQVVMTQRGDLCSRAQGNNVLMLCVPKSQLPGCWNSLVPSGGSRVHLVDNRERLVVTTAPADRRIDLANLSDKSLTVRETTGASPASMVLRVDSPASGWSLLLVQP